MPNTRDASARRAMGLPANVPIVDGGELPAPAAKAMHDGFKASINFRKRIYDFAANQNRSTFAAMERAFQRFMQKTEPPTTDDEFSEPPIDDQLAAAILRSEFASIRVEWSDAFERMRKGESVECGPPMWPWQDTEATKMRKRNPSL